jgi:elongation of very long chain fatty acids protein 4
MVFDMTNEHSNNFQTEHAWVYSPQVLLLASVAYLAVIKSIHIFMKDRPAFECKVAMRVYNVAQVMVCAYMTHGLFWSIVEVAGFVNVAGVSVPNIFAARTPILQPHQKFIFVHYLSKYLDFFDTVFIVLRKKDAQLSFLHVYHHATIGGIWGLLLYMGYGGGSAMFGALLNSFVHVLMYTHFFVTSWGIKNPFKKLLTATQITQFYLCILHAVLGLLIETVIPRLLCLLQFLYQISMVVLFSSFFVKTFNSKAKVDGKAL